MGDSSDDFGGVLHEEWDLRPDSAADEMRRGSDGWKVDQRDDGYKNDCSFVHFNDLGSGLLAEGFKWEAVGGQFSR